MRGLIVLGGGVMLVHSSWAARPLITDDARIVDAKACQVESWVKTSLHTTELWAVPACNFTGHIEVALGANSIRQEGKDGGDTIAQVKTIFKPLTSNGWGMGLAVGTVQHPQYGENRDFYAYLPVTLSFDNDHLFLHTNLGWSKKKADHVDQLTWGIAIEKQLSSSTWLIAEGYGEHGNDPFAQMGIRYWILPSQLQLDATLGDQWQGISQQYISLGFRFLSKAFLP